MPKYSTGGGGGGSDGGACELCGEQADSLTEAEIAGARLTVCSSCAPHDDKARSAGGRTDASESSGTQASGGGSGNRTDRSRNRSPDDGTSPLWDSDTSHWEEGGVSYDSDRLPYLVSDYGERVQEAREEAGLTREEVGEAIGVSDTDLFAIEQGNAAQSGIGGSTISAVEEYLDLTITEE